MAAPLFCKALGACLLHALIDYTDLESQNAGFVGTIWPTLTAGTKVLGVVTHTF